MNLPDCDVCRNPQISLGALLFSSPTVVKPAESSWCEKTHICIECEKLIRTLIINIRKRA